VFQDSTLDKKMTVEENLKMHCVFYRVPKHETEERIAFALKLVDLLEWRRKTVNALSGGMKRRVEIARGLIHYPKVLFLDEPTTGLDPQTRAHVWEYILKLQKEKNITVFLTTHYMDEAENSDKAAIIDHGKIIAYDTPFGLKKQYTQDRAYITVTPETSEKFEKLLTETQMPFIRKETYTRVDITDNSKLLHVLSECKDSVTDMEIRKGTLNDVFLEITGREIREAE
jgi:ABC-2 type transport system ATP-binding protein